MGIAVYGGRIEQAIKARGIRTYEDPEAFPAKRPTLVEVTHDWVEQQRLSQIRDEEDRKERECKAARAASAKMPVWMYEICERRCVEFGVDIVGVLGKSRRHKLSRARQAIYHDLLGTPSAITGRMLTTTQIGHIFSVDHGTVIYGAASHAHREGVPSNNRYNIGYRAIRARAAALRAKQRKRDMKNQEGKTA